MADFALVNVPIAPLMTEPTERCELADEGLYGTKVELLNDAPGGWTLVRTHYRYEGYVQREKLLTQAELVRKWDEFPKMVIMKPQSDVLAEPKVQSWPLASLTRGAIVAPLGAADEGGWIRVRLADGSVGYTKQGYLGEYFTKPPDVNEATLRKRLADTALTYMGVQYRWGGKTPQGIDCSGLCSMAYLLNGMLIYRDADIRDGFCMRKISVEEAKQGDLIFFNGHVAMHLGNGRIVHSTAKNGCDGVVLNSLNPADADYRPDLVKIIRFAGTAF